MANKEPLKNVIHFEGDELKTISIGNADTDTVMYTIYKGWIYITCKSVVDYVYPKGGGVNALLLKTGRYLEQLGSPELRKIYVVFDKRKLILLHFEDIIRLRTSDKYADKLTEFKQEAYKALEPLQKQLTETGTIGIDDPQNDRSEAPGVVKHINTHVSIDQPIKPVTIKGGILDEMTVKQLFEIVKATGVTLTIKGY